MKNTMNSKNDISNNVKNTKKKFDFGFVPLLRHVPSKIIPDSLIIDTILNHSTDTLYFKDIDSKFILMDKALVEQFGVRDQSDLVGKSDFDFFPKDLAEMKRQDEITIMKTGVPIISKMEPGLNALGQTIVLSTSKYPLYNYEGKIIGTWGTSRDMTKLVKAEEELAKVNRKLHELSIIDDLTGLYNQRHFYSTLDSVIETYTEKRSQGLAADFCLIFFDIDDFKKVNDEYGHVVGDTAMRFVSDLLVANTKPKDMTFRYGGDEFSIILLDCEILCAKAYAETIRHLIEITPLVVGKESIHLTISLGVVEYKNEKIASNLLQKADVKLYQAKREGKNLVR